MTCNNCNNQDICDECLFADFMFQIEDLLKDALEVLASKLEDDSFCTGEWL